MELLLRLYEGNKIKSETSIYQLEYTDEIRNQNSKGILVYKGLELNVLERNVNLNKKQVPFTSKEFEILYFWQVILDRYLLIDRYMRLYGEKNIFVMKEMSLHI